MAPPFSGCGGRQGTPSLHTNGLSNKSGHENQAKDKKSMQIDDIAIVRPYQPTVKLIKNILQGQIWTRSSKNS